MMKHLQGYCNRNPWTRRLEIISTGKKRLLQVSAFIDIFARLFKQVESFTCQVCSEVFNELGAVCSLNPTHAYCPDCATPWIDNIGHGGL